MSYSEKTYDEVKHLSERELVNWFVAKLVKYADGAGVLPFLHFIDDDTPDRVAHSAWDFMLVSDKKTVFVEAKKFKTPPERFKQVIEALTPDQHGHFIKVNKFLRSGYYGVESFVLGFTPDDIFFYGMSEGGIPETNVYDIINFHAFLRLLLRQGAGSEC